MSYIQYTVSDWLAILALVSDQWARGPLPVAKNIIIIRPATKNKIKQTPKKLHTVGSVERDKWNWDFPDMIDGEKIGFASS
jgi:hypothetical protein